MVHYKLIYKAYATPCLLYKMKRKSDPFCYLCNSSSQGTYIHMFWDCPQIALLWSLVQDLLSDLLKTPIQKDPLLFLLLDDSSLSLSVNQKRILSAAHTAAKKVILKLWLDPSIPVRLTWMSYLLGTLTVWSVPQPKNMVPPERQYNFGWTLLTLHQTSRNPECFFLWADLGLYSTVKSSKSKMFNKKINCIFVKFKIKIHIRMQNAAFEL